MKSLSIILLLGGIYFVFQSFISKYVIDTEKQVYRVVKKEAELEIRYYPEALMATVYSKGTNYKSVASSGFNKLAKFIFGGNQQKESISMTAPVRMSISENGSSMSFVMPQKYNNQSLPTPNNPNIEIKKSLPEYVAVISFGGYATDEKIAIAYQKLVNILSEKKIITKGGYKLLGYNAPYQFMGRTNEVIIPIEWAE
ncbi:MAG: heme-binding protein [Sediminibacterium sp.]|jgi:hypothetical protein|nr:heme-binding protein [Sediminibacterium sp.]